MDIDYIREFIVLSQTLNFSKASELLHVSQPTLSRHLIALEDEAGVNLFIRTRHNVSLTAEGREFLATAKSMIQQYDRMLQKIHQMGLKDRQRLGVGLLYYQQEYFLNRLQQFKSVYPNITLHLLSATPNELLTAVFNGNIDVCATMGVTFKRSYLLRYMECYTEPLILMTSASHPLSKRKEVSPAELAQEHFICVDDEFYHGYYAYIRSLFRNANIEISDPTLVMDYEMMLLAVRMDAGIAVLTQNMQRYLDNCGTLAINDSSFVISCGWVCREDNINPAVKLFMNYFSKRQR